MAKHPVYGTFIEESQNPAGTAKNFISGASMNPARSLAPALLSDILNDL